MRSTGSMELTGPQYRFHILAILIITAVVAVIYSNTLDAAFHLDDFTQITGNQSLRSLDNLFSILRAPRRGVANVTFALNYAIGGENVAGYHIVNISIHILNAMLVYFLLFFVLSAIRPMRGRARRIAFFCALLFAVHPLQTQAVTYITQRQESLSAFFSLFSLLFFVLALRSGSRFKANVLQVLVPICYVLAFYSKEIAITLPALVFLFDLYFAPAFGQGGQGGWRRRWPLHIVMGVLLIFFVVTSVSALGGFSGSSVKEGPIVKEGSIVKPKATESSSALVQVKAKRPKRPTTAGFGVEGLSSRAYFLTELNVITYYMALLAVPVYQNVDYDFPASKSLFTSPEVRGGTKLLYPVPAPYVSLLIIIAILIAAFYLLRRSTISGGARGEASAEGKVNGRARSRIASFFILWFFIVLLPTSSFIPIIDVIFEHRLYLASLGFFVIFVLFIDWISFCFFGNREFHGA